jgi:dipeptidyl aminopeptidase/acylaminoacyl peptidase
VTAFARTVFVLGLVIGMVEIAPAADERPITAQDLWAFKRVGAPALSPDALSVVFPVQEWSIEKNKSSSRLWLADVTSGKSRPLTQGSASDTSPTWSPDGKRIAFVSKRGEDEANALYLIGPDGGEAEKIVELPYGVTSPKWLPDGKRVAFVTQVIPDLAGKLGMSDLAAMRKEIKRRKESKMTAWVTEHRQYRKWDKNLTEALADRLVLVDIESKGLTDLTPNWNGLFSMLGEASFDVAPDGRHIALALNSTQPPYRNAPNADIYLVPTDGSGAIRNLTPENPNQDNQPRFAPDGKSLIFSRRVSLSFAEPQRVWRHDLATGKNSPISSSLDYSFDEYAFTPDGRSLWLLAEERGMVPIFRINMDGSGFTKVYRTGTSSRMDVKAGVVVFRNDTFNRPDELFVLDRATGQGRQITHFNDEQLARLEFGRVESHAFAGANGDEVQLWLIYPPDYDSNRKYSLVQLLHGGPATMVRDAFSYRWNAHVFAAAGYFVAWVNRHGSTGYGEAFARSIDGAWGDKPMSDIMLATDYLLRKIPAIDAERIAAAGGSYGGYLATWMLGHTDRFRCIVNHAGIADLYSIFGADWISYYFTDDVVGGLPWKNVEGLQRNNPMLYASNFKTPTLIIHGEADYRVPYGNALELYGVLQAMGVPSRLVIYPNENHWILSPQNSIYWNYEVQQWLARYIGGRPMAAPKFGGEAERGEMITH